MSRTRNPATTYLTDTSTSGGKPSRAYFTETKSVPTKKAAISSVVSASVALPFVPFSGATRAPRFVIA